MASVSPLMRLVHGRGLFRAPLVGHQAFRRAFHQQAVDSVPPSDATLSHSTLSTTELYPSSLHVPDTKAALQLLRSQPAHYVVASLFGQRYLLAPRDLLTVPRIKNVTIGEVLCLDEIHELGSREFTLRGEPTLPPDAVSVSVVVVEHTKGDMERMVKKKRRKGYKKTIEHKQTYTRLRVKDIVIGA